MADVRENGSAPVFSQVHTGGAIVTAVGAAASAEAFAQYVRAKAKALALNVSNLENIGLLVDRLSISSLDRADYLRGLASQVEEEGDVAFGTFHTYPKDDV